VQHLPQVLLSLWAGALRQSEQTIVADDNVDAANDRDKDDDSHDSHVDTHTEAADTDRPTPRSAARSAADTFDACAFSLELCEQFSPMPVVGSFVRVAQLLTRVHGGASDAAGAAYGLVEGFGRRAAWAARQLKQCAWQTMSEYLASSSVMRKLVALQRKDQKRVQRSYLALFEQVLVHMQQSVAKLEARSPAQKEADAERGTTAEEPVLDAAYEVLESVNALMSLECFVEAIRGLLAHPNSEIRRHALALLNDKLDKHRAHMVDLHVSLVLDLLPVLTKVVASGSTVPLTEESNDDDDDDADDADDADDDEMATGRAFEPAANRQVSLLTMEILARNFAAEHADRFVQSTLPVLVSALERDREHVVLASALICLATHCAELGPRVLPLLPRFMPRVIALLEATGGAASSRHVGSAKALTAASATVADGGPELQFASDTERVLLLQSVLSSLEVIVSRMHRFLSPYLTRLLVAVLQPTLLARHTTAPQVDRLLGLLAENVKPRLLLPTIMESYQPAIGAGQEALLRVVAFLGAVCENLSAQVVVTQQKRLFRFFLELLDYRHRHAPLLPPAKLSKSNKTQKKRKQQQQETDEEKKAPQIDTLVVEDAVSASFLKFVLKLNEDLFKPKFLLALDWALTKPVRTDCEQVHLGQPVGLERALTFFRLVGHLARNLRAIFVPYFGYLLDACLAYLQSKAALHGSADASDEADPRFELMLYMLEALRECFRHDQEQFVSRERFLKLLKPLTGLLSSRRPLAQYSRLADLVRETLAQLAVCVNNDVLWKALNYEVLLHARDANPRVRYAAVKTIHEFHAQLRESFLVLLPETAPFLDELMEDSDEGVEKATQELLLEIDALLGDEKIEDYF